MMHEGQGVAGPWMCTGWKWWSNAPLHMKMLERLQHCSTTLGSQSSHDFVAVLIIIISRPITWGNRLSSVLASQNRLLIFWVHWEGRSPFWIGPGVRPFFPIVKDQGFQHSQCNESPRKVEWASDFYLEGKKTNHENRVLLLNLLSKQQQRMQEFLWFICLLLNLE